MIELSLTLFAALSALIFEDENEDESEEEPVLKNPCSSRLHFISAWHAMLVRGLIPGMKIEALHVGMKVRHPQYGVGTVKAVSETAAEILFDDGERAIAPEPSGLEPAEPQAGLGGLSIPLKQFIEETVDAAVHKLGLEKPDFVAEQLGSRWHNGKLVLYPGDPTLQAKEVPLETFFHKRLSYFKCSPGFLPSYLRQLHHTIKLVRLVGHSVGATDC